MQVILREDVPDLGIIGDVVNVKPGYARNYLFPRGLAVLADKRNMAGLEHAKRVIEAKRLKERSSVEALAEALGKVAVETEVRAGRGGKLFGSVTNQDIKKMLDEQGFDLDRRRILIKEPIKVIGDHQVKVRVGQDVTTTIRVTVRPLGGELVDESVDGDEAAPVARKAPSAASVPEEEPQNAEAEEASSENSEG